MSFTYYKTQKHTPQKNTTCIFDKVMV